MQNYYYKSPIGFLKIQIKQGSIYAISRIKKFKKNKHSKDLFKPIIKQLDNYFEGQKINSKKISLYPRGTTFQKKVWRSLKNIPHGKTRTYSQTAKALKSPKAFRAVGTACAKNPWLIVVPCHRVLSKTGFGGFALGLKTKKYLLNLEKTGS